MRSGDGKWPRATPWLLIGGPAHGQVRHFAQGGAVDIMDGGQAYGYVGRDVLYRGRQYRVGIHGEMPQRDEITAMVADARELMPR